MKDSNGSKNSMDEIYKLIANIDTPQLKDLLLNRAEELGLSQRGLSTVIGIERKSLQRILEGEAKKIDIVTFLKISEFLGIDVRELVGIYLSKLTPESVRDIEKTRKASFILKHFNLDILRKEGFIENKTDFEKIANKIKSYFGLNSLSEYSAYVNAAYFSRTQRSYSDKMLNFWISLVYHQISKINNPNNYDRELLTTLIPKLRGLTRDESNGLKRAAQSLYEAGVTVIFQSYISKTAIKGATFVSKGSPYIVLTDNQKKYDTIWFSLIHELYHVLKDFKQIEKLTYHITGESDLFIDELTEKNANDFARELLFPNSKMNYIKDFLDIPEYVIEYAEKENVHPSIIYGFYLYKANNNKLYRKYNRHRLKSDVAIKNLLINPWGKENVDEIINEVKHFYQQI